MVLRNKQAAVYCTSFVCLLGPVGNIKKYNEKMNVSSINEIYFDSTH